MPIPDSDPQATLAGPQPTSRPAQLGQHPPAHHVVAHLSDTHLLAGGELLHGAATTEANLTQALQQLAQTEAPVDAIVVTGDLADLGEDDAYERLRGIVEPAAQELGAEVVWVMGNHDEREPFARILQRDGDPGERPQDRVHDIGGLRIVALDTTVPGYHHGELDDGQLEWLGQVLAEPAEHGTLLALHHPPIPVAIEAMATLELLDQHRLADVVRGSDVRGILGGHLHYSTHSTFAGVPVSVSAASCYTLSLTSRERLLSGRNGGQAFHLVHVYDDRVVHSAVPIGELPEISGLPGELRARIERMTPERRREALSRKGAPLDLGDEPDA